MVRKTTQLKLENKRIFVNALATGEKPIMIHGLSPEELEKVAEILDQPIRHWETVRWVSLPKARDKSKVTFFEGGDI